VNQGQFLRREHIGTAEPAARRIGFQLRLVASGLRELFQSRRLIYVLAVRQFKVQYTQSILGYGWAVFRPLFQMVIMSFVFSAVLKIPSQGIEFPLFLFVGLIAWSFFSDGVSSGVDSVAGQMGLINKVYFPREALMIAGILVKLVDFLIACVVFAAVMAFYQRVPTAATAWVPAILAVQIFFTIGVALPLAALNVYFRDMRYLVQVGLLAWMYITPVFYPVSIVPDEYRLIFDLNPMSVFINAYREVIFAGGQPDVGHLGLAALVSTGVFIVGYWMFRSLGRGFADVA
jgi:lipopolysaccharide transport system permease protein